MGERAFAVGSCVIGDGAPVFFVAEAGVNHNGDVGLALALVGAAAECGADAVKFQAFRTDALVSRAAPKAGYQVETTGAGESQREMLARLELSLEDFARVQERCAKRGVVFFSAPFDEASADALERLGVPLFKVPSGEITNARRSTRGRWRRWCAASAPSSLRSATATSGRRPPSSTRAAWRARAWSLRARCAPASG